VFYQVLLFYEEDFFYIYLFLLSFGFKVPVDNLQLSTGIL